MSVERYRTVVDMPALGRVTERLEERVRAVWRRARLLAPGSSYTPGVTRFRSVDEARAARERFVLARARSRLRGEP